MESKEGVFSKLRKLFGGSDKQTAPAQGIAAPAKAEAKAPAAAQPAPAPAAPAKPPMSPAEMVQEKARDLCSDAWLANKIVVKAEARDGKTYLIGSPAEAAPYIRAAYQNKKAELPADVLLA